ncbi:MAG: hypothetical protein ACLR5O_01665 [Romboutsia timonensis]|uniref:hypothetical protein n=1 Tax=Romboutsia timonensis TaxID=1776391 RepID=UPI00399EFFED
MAIKINKDSIELTGKEFDIVRGFIEMNQNGELTLNLDNKDIANDEYNMPSLDVKVLINTRSILNRVDGDNHYLNFANKECTDIEKKKLLEKFLNKIDRPELLEVLCDASNDDIIMDILTGTLNIRNDEKVLSILDSINNFIGFKNFMLFVLDFINYEEKCNHLVMAGHIVSHIDKYGKCDICGKIIPHDSLMIAKMLEII